MKVCIEATYIRVSMKALLGYLWHLPMKASFVQINSFEAWLQQAKPSAIFVTRLSPSEAAVF